MQGCLFLIGAAAFLWWIAGDLIYDLGWFGGAVVLLGLFIFMFKK